MSASHVARPRPVRPRTEAEQRRRPDQRRWWTPWVYLAVPLVLLVAFTHVPAVSMFVYSLTDWDGLSPTRNFVGAGNVQRQRGTADTRRRAADMALVPSPTPEKENE
ncbi:hypothetical protein [Acrocarpospora sp. B8E8]|uniref:hypothetical protein n=1 Tax=Acrocarpospora sp. B8E8 TaxID=3153572 RepID=UPI00325EC4D4